MVKHFMMRSLLYTYVLFLHTAEIYRWPLSTYIPNSLALWYIYLYKKHLTIFCFVFNVLLQSPLDFVFFFIVLIIKYLVWWVQILAWLQSFNQLWQYACYVLWHYLPLCRQKKVKRCNHCKNTGYKIVTLTMLHAAF